MTPDGQRLFDFPPVDRSPGDVSLGDATSINRTAVDPGGAIAREDAPILFAVERAARAVEESGVELFARAVETEREGDFAQAETFYRRLLGEEGPDADVCYNLANVLAATGQIEAALERLSQAVELRPRFAEAWYNQGVLAQRVGKVLRARDCFREALRHAPDLTAAASALQRSLAESLGDHGVIAPR